MKIEDPSAKHEIRIRMLGNSCIYVTCKCMDLTRTNWSGRTINSKTIRVSPEWKSLGDFPVGTPTEELLAAYNKHLEKQ